MLWHWPALPAFRERDERRAHFEINFISWKRKSDMSWIEKCFHSLVACEWKPLDYLVIVSHVCIWINQNDMSFSSQTSSQLLIRAVVSRRKIFAHDNERNVLLDFHGKIFLSFTFFLAGKMEQQTRWEMRETTPRKISAKRVSHSHWLASSVSKIFVLLLFFFLQTEYLLSLCYCF